MSLVYNDEAPLFKMAYSTYAKRKIDEEEDLQNTEHSKKSFASLVQKWLRNNMIDDVLEIFNGFISVLMYITFAIHTYFDEANPIAEFKLPNSVKLAEIVLIFIIAADFLLFFLISETRILYIFSFQNGLITYMTIIPTALVRFEVITDQLVIEKYLLNFWKIFRIFSVFRVIKVFTRRNMPMARVIFKVSYTLLIIVFIGAAAMITFEN